jgi:hypothetical protein
MLEVLVIVVAKGAQISWMMQKIFCRVTALYLSTPSGAYHVSVDANRNRRCIGKFYHLRKLRGEKKEI